MSTITIPGFDPTVQDEAGNNVLHYACEKMEPERAAEIIRCPGINWDFTQTNLAGQTILDFFQDVNTLKNLFFKAILPKTTPVSAGKTFHFKPVTLFYGNARE